MKQELVKERLSLLTVLEAIPLKQGLKQNSDSLFVFMICVLEAIPLKQGLKLDPAQIEVNKSAGLRSDSIKTRIETRCKAVIPSNDKES